MTTLESSLLIVGACVAGSLVFGLCWGLAFWLIGDDHPLSKPPDFAPYSRRLQDEDYQRRHQLDAAVDTKLDPIRRHAVMGTETRPR